MKITKFKYFYPEKPQLLLIDDSITRWLSKDSDWIAERKYNGSRLQLHYLDGKFQFWNRHEARFNYTPSPRLLESLQRLDLKGYCLFDGELRHNKTKGVRDMIMLYDVFIWQSKLLVNTPFWYRRGILANMMLHAVNGEPLGITEWFMEDFDATFKDVIENPEIEGLVLKKRDGMLTLGRSAPALSKWMYKIRKPSGSYRY